MGKNFKTLMYATIGLIATIIFIPLVIFAGVLEFKDTRCVKKDCYRKAVNGSGYCRKHKKEYNDYIDSIIKGGSGNTNTYSHKNTTTSTSNKKEDNTKDNGYSKKTYSYSSYSSGNKDYEDLEFDPIDYDDPDEYADDAWEIDFDDYDDAYDFWEDY